ncbi:MAG: Ldh family oxidoreductase [Negativicutes bacterium]
MANANNVVSVSAIRKFMVDILAKKGVSETDGQIVADNLLKAELWGISSHGVNRFPVYLQRVEAGGVNPCPEIAVSNPFPAVLAVNGDNGLGAVVASKALDAAMNVAGTLGMAVAGIKQSNHFGASGYYCESAAKNNFISIIFTNAPAAVPAWGSKEPYFGTNPIAIGLPRPGGFPVVVDMATSVAARGKIVTALKKNEMIPEGWALNKEGMPTTNPREAMEGVLLPMAGPKGYALALAVEHLSGVLTGAAFGREVAWQYGEKDAVANVGHFILLLRADAFLGAAEYEERMERFCQEIKNSEKMPGVSEIFLPGERERLLEQTLLVQGIEMPAALAQEFAAIAEKYAVQLTK